MIDFHADTIYRLWHDATDQNLQENSLSVSVNGLEKIGAMAQCLAIYTPPQCTWSDMKAIHERFVKELETCKGHIAQATCTDEIRSNGLSAILTVEDMKATEGDWAKVEEVISWKPRIVGPVWNVANAYANPNSKDKAKMALGLTAQGRQLVELLSSHGIIIDVSHMSDGGFWELVDMGLPIVATHSDARALVDHPRNLTDDMIRAIADRGGIVGLNLCPAFLHDYSDARNPEACESRIEDMVRHVMHMRAVGGDEVIALGTDFDGISGALEIAKVEELPRLLDALSDAGLPSSVIDRFWTGNALRVLA